MKTLNNTAYAILGILSIAPMSGYEIRQLMQESTANFWVESDGQLYPALTKMMAEHYVTCKTEKSAGAREKKIYTMTDKGHLALKKWLQQAPNKNIIRNEFMLKLFFGANASHETTLEHVQAERYRAKAILWQLKNTKNQLEANDKNNAHLPYWLMSLDYGIQMTETKLTWCDHVTKTLTTLKRGD
jgi:PadR family transcriptional regulator, regulatory protein AphA